MSNNISEFRRFMSFLKKAIVNPTPNPSDGRVFVRFLFKPVLYDIYALCVQVLDQRRVRRLPMPSADDQSDAAIAIRHNLQEIRNKYITTTRRVEVAYQIATTPMRSVENEKLLIIGCRNVMELHQARFAGFSWCNIQGLDLFSTNDKILTMNMEDMSGIEDSSYDVVTMINTLAYSSKPNVALLEVVRILKPGGRFVFNYGKLMEDKDIFSPFTGDLMVKGNRIPAAEFVNFLQRNGAQLYFHESSDHLNAAGDRQVTHWFGFIKKEPSVDPIWPNTSSE